MAWDFQQCGMFDQQSLGSACAFAQSNQSLCLPLEYSMSVKLLTEHHLEFLDLKEAAEASLSLQLSKCHIVGNHTPRLKCNPLALQACLLTFVSLACSIWVTVQTQTRCCIMQCLIRISTISLQNALLNLNKSENYHLTSLKL